MLPWHLYTLVFALLLQSGVEASSPQAPLPDGLASGFGKKEQVQDVLDHKPVTKASCKQFVSLSYSISRCRHNICASRQVQ